MSRRSVRAERRLFLADGPKAVEGALSLPGCVVEVFASERADSTFAHLRGDAPWTVVEERAIAALSDSVTPSGLVAVCRFVDRPAEDLLVTSRLVTLLADARDPGNAGTVVRCADAAGADAVVLAGTSVDLYNPKTVRASVGSVFHIPTAMHTDPAEAIVLAREAGLQILAAEGDGELELFEAADTLEAPTAWLFGNEAHGLAPELSSMADHRVRIPIYGRAESLNLSTAAALCLYASARAQRSGA